MPPPNAAIRAKISINQFLSNLYCWMVISLSVTAVTVPAMLA